MHNPEELHLKTVNAIVDSISDVMDGEWGDREWDRIVVNYESLLHAPDETTSTIAFSIARQMGGRWERVDFRLSDEAETCLEHIKEDMHAKGEAYWTVCDVIIERDGRYKFDYSYAAPYRLSGNLLDKRLEDYLEHYLSEKRAAH
ncbi:hypothetical protein [Rhizobium sp. 60-20]|jgi:hypothetical protein|uniref:hypothetical protein n=1 Tax=Rhizobium sp. 60-20 TaxID=1895819 RepID=UPI0009266D54|nr:hypothetical protein [Rhizobium sp. 60-20]MBN8954794.1 hypothetical protein [Rhizobium tropici]OJY72008.1 MAG: hypothetical protein BGP09_24955 [Rhizobium sp. 60-20]